MKNLWTFDYEPKEFKDLIVTEEKRITLRKIIDELPNTMIAGNPGTGKGTFMNILIRETGVDYLKINGSDDTGIDIVREKIKSFSTAYSLNKKIVYLNEAHRMSPNAQESLKQIIEDVQHITRFFIVCNDPSKIDTAILSRCAYQINLDNPPAKEIYNRIIYILNKEKIQIKNKSSIVDVIKKLYPDIRQIIGVIQSNVNNNVLDQVKYTSMTDIYSEIFSNMLKKDIESVRKILKSNFIDYNDLFNFCYLQVMDEEIKEIKKPAEFILLTGEFLYKNVSIFIKEINFMTYMLSLMKQGII